jgi:hypothetical protein
MKEYDYMCGYFNGFSRVFLNGYWGFIDENDNEICECKYDKCWNFINGFAPVILNAYYGHINTQGVEIYKPKYHNVGDFVEGYAMVLINSCVSYINEQGIEIIPYFKFNYDAIIALEKYKFKIKRIEKLKTIL